MLNICFLLLAALCSVDSERVLAIFPFIAKSHFFVYEPVLAELTRRGHHVTVISQFPRTVPLDGYTDIDVRGIGVEDIAFNLAEYEKNGFPLADNKKLIDEYITSFEKVFDVTSVQDLLNSSALFDVVITELFISDMFVGLAHLFRAPLVNMMSGMPPPWASDRFALPANPSYIHAYMDTGAGPMSLTERIINCVVFVTAQVFYSLYITSNDERVSKQYLGKDVPHVEELIKNTSLLLVNTHFSLNGARPFPPQVVEIGGIHIKPTKPLPQEVGKFINESEHGVVYFSFGSIANASSMSETMRQAFINSFAKLKQRVLWKWELDELPGKPDNVKILKWMPQRDVLAHPNVKLFISHGGMLGTMEGVHNGVPMIGIPLTGDQYQNVANLEYRGSAILLDSGKITEESLSKALNAILTDQNYKKNAQRLSKLFRDRPTSSLDTAIYWIEYVMRHNGAHHLRTAAVNLPWYQYFLLDVIGVFVLVVILVVIVLRTALKLIIRTVCVKRKEKLH